MLCKISNAGIKVSCFIILMSETILPTIGVRINQFRMLNYKPENRSGGYAKLIFEKNDKKENDSVILRTTAEGVKTFVYTRPISEKIEADQRLMGMFIPSTIKRLSVPTSYPKQVKSRKYYRTFPNKQWNQNQYNEEEPTTCKPLPVYNDNEKCGDRIASRKCCEYIWQMNHKEEILKDLKCKHKYKFGIIGGKNVSTGEFPHMVAIGWVVRGKIGQNRYKFMCGGSLISEKFVLTAGHCTYTPLLKHELISPEPYMVRMGIEDISFKTRNSEIVDAKIKNIIRHPEYKPPKVYNDIALLELFKAQTFTRTIHPACLSTFVSPNKFEKVNVTGWGVSNISGQTMTDLLQKATINTIESNKCWKLIKDHVPRRKFWELSDHQLCAGVLNGGVDTCQGDSGGPIQVKVNTTSGLMHEIIGVTAFGSLRCGSVNSVGVYVKVVSFLSWIEENVWPEEYKTYKVRSRKQFGFI